MTTNFIYNETLAGTVDGVNKSFTSLFTIESIEDLRLWGIDYTDFSFVGNTVTLTDAPTIATWSPSIDYFKLSLTPSATPSNKTFGEFCLDIYEDIGQYITSFQYPLTMVERYVREELLLNLNKRINPLRKVGTYSFNKAVDLTASAYSAVEVGVGTMPTYTPATGKLLIGYGEVVDYSSVSATAFTWISGLEIVYKAGDKVTVGYSIPTWVKKVSEVTVNGFTLTFKDFREYKSTQEGCYTVWENYLFLPRSSGECVVNVTYTKDNVSPVDNSSIMDFEPEYLNVVRFATLVKLFAFRGDERLAITAQLYTQALKDYKGYIARQVDGTNNQIKARGFEGLGNYSSTRFARR